MSGRLAQIAKRWVSTDDTEIEPERGIWARHSEFILSNLGYCVGLGNVWRFPYLCYESGGGAFLVPYFLMLFCCGLPLYFMELAVGQYVGVGPNIIFKRLAPGFKGTGYAMIVVTFLVVLYYNMIIGWTLFYMFASFTSQLAWETCGNDWNTEACFRINLNKECLEKNLTFWNNTCYDPEKYCKEIPNFEAANYTHCLNATDPDNKTYVSLYVARKHISSTEEYFRNYVLGVSGSIENFGSLRWRLVLCLLLSWVLVAVSLIKGVKSSGKVVYFTALFPYAVLFILLIRGATLTGAGTGVYFFIMPEWSKLSEVKVWGDAATQIFYTLGLGFGGLQTLASYNPLENDCCRDAIVICTCCCGTSIFAGIVIFMIMGFMAHSMQVGMKDVATEGQGLAFIAYPEAVTHMPFSPFWSFLFFFMILTVGLDSQFVMVETLITSAQDEWPFLRKRKSSFVVLMCAALFLLGLPLCGEGGVYYFTLLDSYSAGWPLVVITTIEALLLTWNYGIDRFSNDVKQMIGNYPGWYWKVCWSALSPMVNVGIILFLIITYKATRYGEYEFPPWANALGWLMALSSVIMIPIFAIHEAYKIKTKEKPWGNFINPTDSWKPQRGDRPRIGESRATSYQVTETPPLSSPQPPTNIADENINQENKNQETNVDSVSDSVSN